MKLSIIIITYNQEKYVQKMLDSILSQEFDCQYEIYVGDDASSDNTPNIILDYMRKYPKVIHGILRKENLGVIKNYFDLVSRCTGEYIMECAGDDYWEPGKVKSEIEYMENHSDISIACGAVNVVDENGAHLGIRKGNIHQLTFEKLLLFNPVSALSICFRRDDMEQYIKCINPINQHWSMEDYPFLLWTAKNKKMGYIPKILGSYRIVSGSLSNSIDIEKQIKFEKSVHEIRLFYADKISEKRKVESVYCKNMAHIYLLNNNVREYWKYTLKSKNAIAFFKAPFKVFKYYYLNKEK